MPIGGASHQQFGLEQEDGREPCGNGQQCFGQNTVTPTHCSFQHGFKGRKRLLVYQFRPSKFRTSVRHLRSIADSARIRIGTAISRRTLTARSRRNGICICRFQASPCKSDKRSRGSQVIRMTAKALRRTSRRPSPSWPRRTNSQCSGPPRVIEKFSATEDCT